VANFISNQRPRLNSKHPPMKEKMPTATPVAMPVKKAGS